MPKNETRTIRITYIEELTRNEKVKILNSTPTNYNQKLQFTYPIEKYSLSISIDLFAGIPYITSDFENSIVCSHFLSYILIVNVVLAFTLYRNNHYVQYHQRKSKIIKLKIKKIV
jgi:hypothetical protein